MQLSLLCSKCRKYSSVSKFDGFGKRPLDHINRRENNIIVMQPTEHFLRQSKSFICSYGIGSYCLKNKIVLAWDINEMVTPSFLVLC